MLLIVVVATVCSQPAQGVGVPPAELAGLRLPRAAHVRVRGWLGTDTQPFDAFEVIETLDWLWGRQDVLEGTVGDVPLALTLATAERTLYYDVRSRRGILSSHFADTGSTRLDGLASPLAWVRRACGGTSKTSVQPDGRMVVEIAPRHAGAQPFTCVLSAEGRRLDEVRSGSGAGGITYRYGQWTAMPDGTELPFEVRFETVGPTGALITKTLLVESASIEVAASDPPRVDLPQGAVVDDWTSGVVRSGNGAVLAVEPSAQPSPSDGGGNWWTLERGLVVAGGVLVTLAIAWRMRGRWVRG